MPKEQKTNAMRHLDKLGIPYAVQTYRCPAFTDGIAVAEQLGLPVQRTFKTLVTQGKSGRYYVFVIPVAEELDLKRAAHTVNEKSVAMLHVKDIPAITGYIRGGCSPIGMKKSFPTFLEACAMQYDSIFISGGRLGTQIELSPEGLLKAAHGALQHITMEKTQNM